MLFFFLSRRFVMVGGTCLLVACSGSSTGDSTDPTVPAPSTSASGTPTPTPTTTGTSTAKPPVDAGADAPVDRTPVLTFVRDGVSQTLVANSLTVKKETDGSWTLRAGFPAVFPRQPPLDPGQSSIYLSVKDKAGTSCSNDNVVSLLYQEPNGTITSADSASNGSCTMTVAHAGDDGLFEGTATGTLGNKGFNRSWPFSLTWRQPAP